MDELFDTSSTWIGVDEDGVESEYKTLMVFTTDRRDALYILCTHDFDKDPEEMEVRAMRIDLHEDAETISLRGIDTVEDWDAVSRAFDRYRRCHEHSHAANLEEAGAEDAIRTSPIS